MESGLRPYPLLNVTDENHKLYQLLNYRTMDVLNVIDLAPLYPEYLVCFSLFGIYIGNLSKLHFSETIHYSWAGLFCNFRNQKLKKIMEHKIRPHVPQFLRIFSKAEDCNWMSL